MKPHKRLLAEMRRRDGHEKCFHRGAVRTLAVNLLILTVAAEI
jgi:hypothetical protein